MANGLVETEAGTAKRGDLDRNRQAVESLSVTARKMRFTSSRRSPLLRPVGLRPRLVDIVFKYFYVAAFLLVLVGPNAVVIAYYGFIASDQYQAETRFTVRTSAPVSKKDGFGEITGIPSAKIGQDTQIVTNFVKSRSMLDTLETDADFVARYARSDADWYARLDRNDPKEERLDYWEEMVSTHIDPQSGIITVQVRAFSAEDANAILKVVVSSSEKLINDLNDRIWADVTKAAEQQVDRATKQLAQARATIQQARNEAGILTIESTSATLSGLLTQVQAEKIALESRYETNSANVSSSAPQMIVLARQIAIKSEQIEQLKAQIAGTSGSEATLADTSSQFSQLSLEQQIAELQLTSSITAFEQLRYTSQQQLMYLEGFLAPTMPDSADYPRRMLWISVSAIASLVLLSAVLATMSAIRTRLD